MCKNIFAREKKVISAKKKRGSGLAILTLLIEND